jgi:hypothetical protein
MIKLDKLFLFLTVKRVSAPVNREARLLGRAFPGSVIRLPLVAQGNIRPRRVNAPRLADRGVYIRNIYLLATSADTGNAGFEWLRPAAFRPSVGHDMPGRVRREMDRRSFQGFSQAERMTCLSR